MATYALIPGAGSDSWSAAEFGFAVEAQPWAREIELTDPDGNRLRIGTVPS